MSEDLKNGTGNDVTGDAERLEEVLVNALAPEKGARAAGMVWLVLLLAAAIAIGMFLKDPIYGLFKGKSEAAKTQTTEGAAEPGNAQETQAEPEKKKYTCGMHPQIVQDEPGFCPVCGMKLTPVKPQRKKRKKRLKGEAACKGRTILFYQAPMDPNFTSPAPGKSPMGMDLVPVCEGDELEAEGGISIDPRIRQNMGVRTKTAKKGPVMQHIRVVGHVDFDERRLAILNTKIDGWVEKLYVDSTGQWVKKGQRLASLYSPSLVSTQEELLLAYRRYRQSKSGRDETLWKAARERLKFWDISLRQIKRIERTGKAQRTLTVYAPFNGVVVDKRVVEGQYVKAGAVMFNIADLSKVWVYIHVYEMDVPFVKVGQKVDMVLPYDPGAKVPSGIVDYVYPWLDKKARDVKARVVFDNSSGYLKPEMYVTATLHGDLKRIAVLVDDAAIIRSGERNVAFVEIEPGTFEPRVVKLGVQMDDKVEILEGIAAGEKVVTNGQFMLDSESRLKEALTKFEPEDKEAAKDATKDATKGAAKGAAKDEHEGHDMKGMKDGKKQSAKTPAQALDALMLDGCTYTCPMPSHFHVCGKGPGKCPECGMNLVPVEGLLKRHGGSR
ncbi:MAG: efflux RND transporter periplasmic adaptor subunit [Deltaproteobacteria bacterium]|nr:efflux RND transporter periplasmic adaptor subunit [Deltaproteobacteria bacterium]